MSSLHLYMLQSWERGHTPGKLVLPFSMVAKTALKPLIFNFRQSYTRVTYKFKRLNKSYMHKLRRDLKKIYMYA